MILGMECKKMKGTGFLPAFLGGGMLAAAVPLLNMAVRRELYVRQEGSPVRILMNANWQVMAMLNVLMAVAGSCIMYHTEYADNAVQKMRTLPLREYKLFFGKAGLMFFACILMLMTECAGVAFCCRHWFTLNRDTWIRLAESFGYALLLMLPAVFFSLLAASVCRNLWGALGIGVACVFTAAILPADSFPLNLFPFSLPFRIWPGTIEPAVRSFMIGAAAETALAAAAEILFLKLRRWFV